MEQTYQEKIQGVIDEALTQKTFSLEIIEKIKAIKDQAALLEKDNKSKAETIEANNKYMAKQRAKIESMQKCLNDWLTISEKLKKESTENDKLRYELNFQRIRADEIKELYSIVFRNPKMQEHTYRNIPIERNGYIEDRSQNETKTKEIIP